MMVYFLIYLFLETLVSVNISSSIGGLATFFEIVISAVIGFFILANFRYTLAENFAAISFRHIDIYEFERLNLFSLLGAILLIIPGFLTDIIGILLQFSVVTSLIINRYKIKKDIDDIKQNSKKDGYDDIIDVEIIEK